MPIEANWQVLLIFKEASEPLLLLLIHQQLLLLLVISTTKDVTAWQCCNGRPVHPFNFFVNTLLQDCTEQLSLKATIELKRLNLCTN